jgi:murein DD-endopeptidase MepM/ murein hydrolase activator NlpD
MSATVDERDAARGAGHDGRAAGVHLHWEIDLNGSPVNPRVYL